MTSNADDRDPLDIVAEEFLTRHRQGESPRVEDYTTRVPGREDEVRAMIETIVAMESMRPPSEATTARRRGAAVSMPIPVRIGDFKIISEIGRGGMGIVYKAQQESLDRVVAVKVLPKSSLLDEQQLERFHREAQTAARLHHSNIVPVFGVGEYEGLHYYVMQLIDGVPLDKIVRELRGVRDNVTPTQPTASSGAFTATTAAFALCRGTLAQFASRGASSDVHIDVDRSPTTPNGVVDPGPTVATTAPGEDTSPVRHVFTKSYWGSVAKLGIQIGAALHYAHNQGILHRDIKPSNLLVDQKGVVWVTDFGIAKAFEKEGLTEAGDFVGTLQYMAPEQSSGKPTRQSDVYSLGLTLYELMTLQRAFTGKTPNEILRLMHEAEPERPSKIVKNVPRDLETIIQKAIAKDPHRRYSNCGELADDLRRFLEDRPILARRVGSIERLGRWCRRNRAIAAAAAIALVALIAAAASGWVGYVTKRDALTTESQRRREADAATTRAERNLELALEAFDDVFDRLAGPDQAELTEEELAEEQDVPRFEIRISQKDAALLERMLAFYDQFAVANTGSTKLETSKARAQRRVGEIQKKLGDTEAATAAYKKSLATFTDVATRAPSDEVLIEMAAVRQEIGLLEFWGRGGPRFNAVLGEFKAAIALLTEQTAQPDSPRVRYELVRTRLALGSFAVRRDFFGPGRRSMQRPQSLPSTSNAPASGETGASGSIGPGPIPPPQGSPSPQGGGRQSRSPGYADLMRVVEEEVAKARRTALELLDLDRRNPGYRLVAAQCHEMTARLWHWTRRDEARAEYSKAVSMMELLVADHPNVPDYRFELSQMLFTAGTYFAPSEGADDAMLRVREIAAKLAADHDEIPAYLNLDGRSRLALGRMELDKGHLDAAHAEYTAANAVFKELGSRFPTSSIYGIWIRESELRLAEVLERLDRPADAEVYLRSVYARLKEMRRDSPRGRFDTRTYNACVESLARVLEAQGKLDEAVEMKKEIDTSRPRR